MNYSRRVRSVILAGVVALSLAFSVPAQAAASRDILWDIVSKCLDPAAADYCTSCRSPRVETACAAELLCKQTTEVWGENSAYVVIRDRKSCGCPAEFVHALAIPRSRVAGVEDPNRPEGIWEYAWGIGMKKIPDQMNAALAVNPAGKRAQDQLHVHILRLRDDARERFLKNQAARIERLDEVWKKASALAAAAGLADYGVLVTRHPESGFLVVVTKESPEKSYTIERCR